MKLRYSDDSLETFILQLESVFSLHEFITRTEKEAAFTLPAEGSHDYVSTQKVQPTVTPEDFNNSNRAHVVIGWKWNLYSDGVALEFMLASSQERTLLITPPVLALLKEYVNKTIMSGDLVDLEDFRQLDLLAMEDVILHSPSQAITNSLEYLETSFDLLTKNYEELSNHLSEFEGDIRNPDLLLWTKRHNVTLYMREALRLLHNFVASCQTLVEHTRQIYRMNYEDSQLFPDYNDRVRKDFLEDPLARFIQDLRNYTLHFGLPSIGTTTRFDKGRISGSVYISKDRLLNSGWKWKKGAREFLKYSDNDISLAEAMKRYYLKIKSFQHWFRHRRLSIHRGILHERSLMIEVLRYKRSTEVERRLEAGLRKKKLVPTHKLLEIFAEGLSAEDLHYLNAIDDRERMVKLATKKITEKYFISDRIRELMLKQSNP